MPLLPWRWSVAAIAACAVVAPVIRAGEPPRFESRLDLVQIDVVVVDAKGQPIRGLTPDDFEVLEGGRRQEIASFEPIVVEPGAASTSAPASADVPLGEGV
ncbi:MAG TPA: hypothetical protein VGQ33_06850, partial [Vicinamibacteria bacterium]|nr:hypothetical protein [Vicinamibacteria bacterium]